MRNQRPLLGAELAQWLVQTLRSEMPSNVAPLMANARQLSRANPLAAPPLADLGAEQANFRTGSMEE